MRNLAQVFCKICAIVIFEFHKIDREVRLCHLQHLRYYYFQFPKIDREVRVNLLQNMRNFEFHKIDRKFKSSAKYVLPVIFQLHKIDRI